MSPSTEKLTPSRRIRDLLGAGGAYLLALGGGVLIGPAVAIGFVIIGSLFLALVGASMDTVQRRVPGVGRWPFVEDQGFRVVAGSRLNQLREAEAKRIESNESEPSPIRFEAIKPRIEAYLDEARAMWTELAERPAPDRVGALYDQAMDWQNRVVGDLSRYHRAVAVDFRDGGSILSPQLGEVAPTDCATLQVCVERRGQVLRNLMDGTPGLKLEWSGRTSFF